jgi:hypothetical protein
MTHRIAMTCSGVPPEIGPQAAEDIAAGFRERPWHQNVSCTWDGSQLRIQADNDYDPEGKALGDEFSDEICANTPASFDFEIKLESAQQLSA